VEGTCKGVTDPKIVCTGGHTHTRSALVGNDEFLLRHPIVLVSQEMIT
jgi:hypothetical protein